MTADTRAEHASGGRASASEATRERVRATIGRVGGYWRPLAAVARLQEELGELAELLSSSTLDAELCAASRELCASELADLWIITTALADQFLACVAEPGSHEPRLRASPDLLLGLVVAAGPIARIVNHYDGLKTPRTFEGWISLGDAVAEFQRALADVAHAHEVDLAVAVDAKLDAIPTLDSGRFRSSEHDPSTAVSLERFRAFRAPHPASAGPEAERARLWGSPEWSSDSSPDPFTSNVKAVVADLASFAKAAPWERLDAYLVCGPAFASTAPLEAWFARLLAELAAGDPAAAHPLAGIRQVDAKQVAGAQPLDGAERRFAFGGLELRAALFASLYDARDQRHSQAGTFALLRVEDAVRRERRGCG